MVTRLIALIIYQYKIFEKCPCQHIYSFLEKNNFTSKRELFGIRSSHSTNHDNVTLLEKMKKHNDVSNYVCNVFIDSGKAFNNVDYQVLPPSFFP